MTAKPETTGSFRVARASAVVVQRVAAADADWFLEWQRGMATAAEGYDGYQGTDVFPPNDERGDEWVVALHFADDALLQKWLESPARAGRIDELRARVGDFAIQRLSGGFGPWFSGLSKAADAPPAWRMAFTVLFALYPTVMVLSLFPGPRLSPLGFPLSMLVSNALSVVILQWVVMPLVMKLVAPWINAKSEQRGLVLGGAVAIVAALTVFLFVFRSITG